MSCVVCHIARCILITLHLFRKDKLAFMYARKAYLLDSISQKDPKHLLKMTVHLAEFSAMMSKYNESMRYAYSGSKLAQE